MTTKEFVDKKQKASAKNSCKIVTKANKPQNNVRKSTPARQSEGRTK